uniref:Sugar phosphate transporter domain-containing protein n=1 Tax=Kalanchoe fedtschenkoi TaxID=63787 RepID=A0A7N0UZ30_KALFE
MADRASKEQLLTYAYLLLYIALSSGQIFFNKWVLSSKEINFPYPLGLTLLHMVFSSVLCYVLTRFFKVFKVEEGMTSEIYVRSVIPIGATFAMTLWLGNTAYLYISVAFAQMLKAIMPVAVFVLGVAAGLEIMSCRMLFIMSVISFGVLVASYGEININWIGVVYQMGGVVGEALRLIFMEILVKRKGLKLNPISVMYYVSPCSALCLLIPWIFLEKPKMDANPSWHFQPIVLILNSLCTFALNLSVFLVITHTSALTIRVAGVVKDWVVVLLSSLLFADTKLTLINLFGYGIGNFCRSSPHAHLLLCEPNCPPTVNFAANPSLLIKTSAMFLLYPAIAGVAAYNNHKLKKEVSKSNADQSRQEESIPMVTPETSDR